MEAIRITLLSALLAGRLKHEHFSLLTYTTIIPLWQWIGAVIGSVIDSQLYKLDVS